MRDRADDPVAVRVYEAARAPRIAGSVDGVRDLALAAGRAGGGSLDRRLSCTQLEPSHTTWSSSPGSHNHEHATTPTVGDGNVPPPPPSAIPSHRVTALGMLGQAGDPWTQTEPASMSGTTRSPGRRSCSRRSQTASPGVHGRLARRSSRWDRSVGAGGALGVVRRVDARALSVRVARVVGAGEIPSSQFIGICRWATQKPPRHATPLFPWQRFKTPAAQSLLCTHVADGTAPSSDARGAVSVGRAETRRVESPPSPPNGVTPSVDPLAHPQTKTRSPHTGNNRSMPNLAAVS